MKKVLVVSHERSGTYFLAETIARNFGYRSYGERVDLDDPTCMYCNPLEMRLALSKGMNGEPVANMPYRRIFKSHHTRDFFDKIWLFLTDQFTVFYIYRDGRDVMTSFWRHAWKLPAKSAPVVFTVGQFMRRDPLGYAAERYHGKVVPANMVERWQAHVDSWLGQRIANVVYINYESMCDNFEYAIEKIARALVQSEPSDPERPPLGGVHPWKGVKGNWKDFFDEEDEDFFWSHGKYAMSLMGYEREPTVWTPVSEQPRGEEELKWLTS